jgi:hypothetical protein
LASHTVVLLAYHYGPGQTELARDYAREKIAFAQKLEQDENWRAATNAYAEALAKLPGSDKSTAGMFGLRKQDAHVSGDLPRRLAKWKAPERDAEGECRDRTGHRRP